MSQNNDQYTIPLAIDTKGFLTGLDEMEAGLNEVTNSSKKAGAAITEVMTGAAKSGDVLVTKMNAGAASAKALSDAAKAAGADIGKAFSGDNIKPDGLAQKITQFVAKMKDAAGKPVDFKFNIDSTAVKTLVDKMTQAKGEMASFNLVLDSAKQRLVGLSQGSAAFNELNDQIVTAETFLKNLKETTEDVEKPTITLRQQIRLMREELAQMELAGKGGTKEFLELSKRAGNLADQFADTSHRVLALASDTKGLDAGITAVRGLAGAFAVGQGALALFGDQNEEVAKTIAKVQGAMALLQGVQEVANVLNKDSALSVYLQTFARKAHIVALAEETVAVEADAAATASATAATEAWTIALLANPITALIAVLATAAFTIYEFASAQKIAGLNADQFNKYLEVQQGLLEEDLARIQHRLSLEEAVANNQRRNQSVLQEIRLNGLKSQKRANQDEFEELSSSILKLNAKDKDYEKSKAELNKRLEDLEKKRSDTFFQIAAEEINLQKQKNDERIKLADDFLKERQLEAVTEVEIAKQARDYGNQIQDAKISELRESQEKELKILDQALKVKIQNYDSEHKAKLTALKNQKADLQVERALADENGKKVIDLQVANLNRQIELTTQNGARLKQLEIELTTANEVAKLEVIKKYAEQRRDIEFQVANTLLAIQDQSLKQKLAIIDLAAQHENDIIERTNQDKALKDFQQDAVERKRLKDRNDATLSYKLQQVDIEKTMNDTLLMNNKKFFDQSRDAQALQQLLLAQNELNAAEVRLKILTDAGKKETDQEVVNLKNRIAALKGEMAKLTQDTKPKTLAELLFPDDDKNQRRFTLFMDSLQQVGAAVHAYTDLLISQYQKQIDAQKKVVSNDDQAINNLQDQLKTEQALRDKGYANNVTGIQKLINEKNKQRDEDVKKQEEYQKKMEKVQRAQMIADTALQAVNLATAATKIFLSASDLGPVGEVIAAGSVIAMIAAFAYAKAQAFAAANTSTFAEGGVIGGKSHAQGGQKYYSRDASGGIMELEEGEHVTRKSQTEKYFPLLDAINHDKVKDMSGDAIDRLLRGTGIHRQGDIENRDAVAEARQNYSDEVNVIAVNTAQRTPKELVSIDNTLQQMASRSSVREEVYEEDGFIVRKKGNRIIRTRKR